MTACTVWLSTFPRRGGRRTCLAAVLAALLLTMAGGLLPVEARADEDIAATLIGNWTLDREATNERLSETPRDDVPAKLPPFELEFLFKEDSVTTDVTVGGISKKQGFRWRVLEKPSDSEALVEFLPTSGLPRRHKFRLLSDGRLELDAQGAKYTLILARGTTP